MTPDDGAETMAEEEEDEADGEEEEEESASESQGKIAKEIHEAISGKGQSGRNEKSSGVIFGKLTLDRSFIPPTLPLSRDRLVDFSESVYKQRARNKRSY